MISLYSSRMAENKDQGTHSGSIILSIQSLFWGVPLWQALMKLKSSTFVPTLSQNFIHMALPETFLSLVIIH